VSPSRWNRDCKEANTIEAVVVCSPMENDGPVGECDDEETDSEVFMVSSLCIVFCSY